MKPKKLALLLCNLGTPVEPTPAAVRAFLKPFLNDRRVVEVPRPIWWVILNAFILPFRPKPVAEAYSAIWQEFGESPLRLITKEQVEKLQVLVDEQNAGEVVVDYVFTYGEPSLKQQVENYAEIAEKVVLLPLYPQYSCSTTAAIFDQLSDLYGSQRNITPVHVIKHYYQTDEYRDALKESVTSFWAEHGQSEHLLISYHGVPQRYADLGDPYYSQCLETSESLIDDLGLDKSFVTTSFQSRLGKAEWLKPYTDKTVVELAQKGVKQLDVVCPSFSVDCLETLEEIAVENGQYFTEAGGVKLRLVPCLNASEAHINMMYALVKPYLGLVV